LSCIRPGGGGGSTVPAALVGFVVPLACHNDAPGAVPRCERLRRHQPQEREEVPHLGDLVRRRQVG